MLGWSGAPRETSRRRHAGDPQSISAALTALGLLRRNTGKYEGVRALLERAAVITEALYGPNHPDAAGSLINLAGLDANLGEFEAAMKYLTRALEAQRCALGDEHSAVAGTLLNLGSVLAEALRGLAVVYIDERRGGDARALAATPTRRGWDVANRPSFGPFQLIAGHSALAITSRLSNLPYASEPRGCCAALPPVRSSRRSRGV